ncbi:hypothetical protein NP493_68g00014 [Ridgeia piscesae]|uniref:Choline transporter-like protein n=1 Tax=Ridgeia piscesae TaxID=27915 RepID=A0AAD9UIS9_RIDPI|nr:hypothetical protein NP493_68g00014 [Ridgeia piscesae]
MGRCLPSKLPKALDHMVDRFNESISKEVIIKGSHYIAFLIRAQDVGLKILQDIHASWKLCVILLATAMGICLVWITLMRWIAGYLVWSACLLFVVSFCIAAGISLAKYFHMKDNPDHHLQGPLMLTKDMSYYWNLAYTWLTIGIVCLIIVAVIVLLLLFLRKHLQMAILIIKEASRAVGMMKFTLLWPLIPFVLQLSMFFFWGVCAMYPYCCGLNDGNLSVTYQWTSIRYRST